LASPAIVPPELIQIAEDSLKRIQGEAFFQAFYRRLLGSNPAFPPMFAKTDFQRQHKLLQHGLGLLLIFAKRRNPSLLARIADRHSGHDLNILPAHYPNFVDSLVATAREFDPQFSPAIEEAWRRSVAPGITFMSDQYNLPATRTDG